MGSPSRGGFVIKVDQALGAAVFGAALNLDISRHLASVTVVDRPMDPVVQSRASMEASVASRLSLPATEALRLVSGPRAHGLAAV